MPPVVIYRQAHGEDLPFVYSTWLRNARQTGHFRFMTHRVYYENEKVRIARLIERDDTRLLVICNPDDRAQIYGWICFTQVGPLLAIHYAYMKEAYRGLGIMKDLLTQLAPRFGKDQVAITAVSEDVLKLRQKFNLVFDPYVLAKL